MFKKMKNYKKTIMIFLVFLSLISLLNNCYKALKWSADFQWHPSTLLLNGINHYQYFLNGGKGFLSQLGEYGHGLYVLLLPFANLDWEYAKFFWMLTNVFFVFLIPLIICKKFKISKNITILIICIFATCSPTRTCINYGQQSLLIMFFFILPFVFNNKKSALLSGISYFKYSVGYVVPVYFLISKKFKFFLLSTIPAILGWIIYFTMTNSDPITNLFEPLILGVGKSYARGTDLYSILSSFNILENKTYNTLLAIFFSISINGIFLYKINKIDDNLLKLSLICLSVVIFAPHSNYDYIFLLPLLIYSITNINENKFNLFIIIFYFYFSKIIKHLLGFDSGETNLYDSILFLTFFYCLIKNIFFNNAISSKL